MDSMENKIKTLKYASGVNVLAGIWLFLDAFVFAFAFGATTASAWNDIVVGLAVITLATWHIVNPEAHGASWTNSLLGAWLLIAPTMLHYSVVAHLWNDIIVGFVLVVFGAWAAMIQTTPKHMHLPRAG